MEKQSFRIGVDKLYLAKVLTDTSSGATYDTPFAVPGVVTIAAAINNSDTPIYADDGKYETYNQEGEIKLTISLAGLTAEVRADVTGGTYTDSNGLLVETNGQTKNEYAVMFRSQKAVGEYRYITYSKGTFSKPDMTAATKASSVTPQNNDYMFTGLNRVYDGKWRQSVDSDDPNIPTGLTNSDLSNASTGWFADPDYVPVASGTPISDLAVATGTGASGTMAGTMSAATGATSVKVQVYDPVAAEWNYATLTAALTEASTSFEITGLTGGNTYTVRLVVVGGAASGISNTDSAAAVA